jgi:predicted nuclease of restriction endonuclease-like (RecB) superfamily
MLNEREVSWFSTKQYLYFQTFTKTTVLASHLLSRPIKPPNIEKNETMKKKNTDNKPIKTAALNSLFDRVVAILEEARANVVRSVNNNIVSAYWLIGQEIVQELQSGEERAEYGKRLLENLSERLVKKYGEGYSISNLRNFRQFYLVFKDRTPKFHHPTGSELEMQKKHSPVGSESSRRFHPNLSWSHYRALMRVESRQARDFYETESVRCGWDKRTLERQISTLFYERLLKSRDKNAMLQQAASATQGFEPIDVLKDPYILEFLNLPNTPKLHESKLEEALIANLRQFLLELGKGFSFVARQKHIRIGSKDFYVDLVFYNYLLKCFVLIDLKDCENELKF